MSTFLTARRFKWWEMKFVVDCRCSIYLSQSSVMNAVNGYTMLCSIRLSKEPVVSLASLNTVLSYSILHVIHYHFYLTLDIIFTLIFSWQLINIKSFSCSLTSKRNILIRLSIGSLIYYILLCWNLNTIYFESNCLYNYTILHFVIVFKYVLQNLKKVTFWSIFNFDVKYEKIYLTFIYNTKNTIDNVFVILGLKKLK